MIVLHVTAVNFYIMPSVNTCALFLCFRMWFLRPSRDINLLKQRQKAVSYFMGLRNAEVVASLQDCLKHIKNVSVSSF